MRTAGVIGWPLKASLSPVFQQPALDSINAEIQFRSFPVPPPELERFIEQLRQPQFAGVCITVPHKERVMPLADVVSDEARAIGAINWLINADGKLEGHNTDAHGFLAALEHDLNFVPSGKSALVIGAGGAARAVVYALRRAGASKVAIWNRTQSRAAALANEFNSERCRVTAVEDPDAELERSSTDLLVNASSIGMDGTGAELPFSHRHVAPQTFGYDLVYASGATPFVRQLRLAGTKVASGLSMLVYQGADGFRLLTGRAAPVQVMFDAIDSHLKTEGD